MAVKKHELSLLGGEHLYRPEAKICPCWSAHFEEGSHVCLTVMISGWMWAMCTEKKKDSHLLKVFLLVTVTFILLSCFFVLFCFGLGWVGFFWLILKLFTTFVFVRSLIERLKLWFAHYTSCPTLSPICNPWSPALHHSGRKKSRKHVVWCACTNHCITSLLCFFPSKGFKVQKAYSIREQVLGQPFCSATQLFVMTALFWVVWQSLL